MQRSMEWTTGPVPPRQPRAGQGARAMQAHAASATSGWLRLARRLLGAHDAERAWRVGAEGEEQVGHSLATLDDRWTVVHDLPLNERGSNLDHLVIGPTGAYALNTKNLRGRVWVGERTVMVSGQKTSYLRTARWEAATTARLLSAATGRRVFVFPVLVFIARRGRITIEQLPRDVGITTDQVICRWLNRRPVTMDPHHAAVLRAAALRPSTWPVPKRPPTRS